MCSKSRYVSKIHDLVHNWVIRLNYTKWSVLSLCPTSCPHSFRPPDLIFTTFVINGREKSWSLQFTQYTFVEWISQAFILTLFALADPLKLLQYFCFWTLLYSNKVCSNIYFICFNVNVSLSAVYELCKTIPPPFMHHYLKT